MGDREWVESMSSIVLRISTDRFEGCRDADGRVMVRTFVSIVDFSSIGEGIMNVPADLIEAALDCSCKVPGYDRDGPVECWDSDVCVCLCGS